MEMSLPAAKLDQTTMSPAVLLVEDEVVVRALLAEELRYAGMTVTEAANADEAWAFLQAGGTADLLFSDVKMPGSMDGVALMRLVRRAFPAIKIVMTSGNMGPFDVGEFDGFLPKPYTFTKAVLIAAHLLGVQPPEPE
jgi:CheY-like chemotaxis protein